MKRKILILHTSVGLGHKTIAQNMAWHLERATSLVGDTRQEGFEVRLADIGRVQKGKFEHAVVGAHRFVNRYLPFVWSWLYSWGHYIILPFRVAIAGFNYKSAKALVDEFRPDLIIATQTTASAVTAYLKKKNLYRGKFAIAFSDYHLHPYWLYKAADLYLANTEDQKYKMIAKAKSPDKIFVCGIILRPKLEVDAAAVRQKFGIDLGENVVLIGTGSLGLGFKQQDLEDLAKLQNTKILFACGKNGQLFEEVKSLKHANVIALGFYTPMDELYAIADIFIGKPGGLSTAEALQWHLPLLIAFALPGQEEKNLKFLAEKKLVIPRPRNILATVQRELQTHEFKKQLLGNPYAREIIGKEGALVSAVKTVLAG